MATDIVHAANNQAFIEEMARWLQEHPEGDLPSLAFSANVSVMATTFACATCFDTETIDVGGREIVCPDCTSVTIKLTGLAHGLGLEGERYATATAWTSSTITFTAATKAAILADVTAVERKAKAGAKGRTSASSWAIAIAQRVRRS